MNNEWQPMETAPKDGRYILTWSKGGGRSIMYRSLYSDGWCEDHDGGEEKHFPTHWMPLPEPPEKSS